MTFYDILEVSPNASKEIIANAYKTLARKYHPDLNPPEFREQAEENMRIINQAREVLMNDDSRFQYDIELQSQYNVQETVNNEDITEDKFKKLPNWLRWILALPIAYISYVAVKFLFSISMGLTVGINSPFLNNIYDVSIATSVFIIMFHAVVPKYKFKATIVLSIIIGLAYIIVGTLVLYTKRYLDDSFILTIIAYPLGLISVSITCRMLHKNKIINN